MTHPSGGFAAPPAPAGTGGTQRPGEASSAGAPGASPRSSAGQPFQGLRVVLDTNIVLDLFVFGDAAAEPLRRALQAGEVLWLATAAMREELARVLAYPQIVPRLADGALGAEAVLAHFDRHARLVEPAPPAPATCEDPDDQRFIDLAVAHRAQLLSKDRAVLGMARRLAHLGARAAARFTPPALPA